MTYHIYTDTDTTSIHPSIHHTTTHTQTPKHTHTLPAFNLLTMDNHEHRNDFARRKTPHDLLRIFLQVATTASTQQHCKDTNTTQHYIHIHSLTQDRRKTNTLIPSHGTCAQSTLPLG
mmetsp:Transcript_14840/g.41118  ORF Transcript_14840/g.41118 Transcript_14840/m.41118 type:complete len:118 (-) Transcript_14840:177-530(-)